MLTGLAWALRETQGPAAAPAAPAAIFRKSRRVASDCEGCAIRFPLVCDVDDPSETFTWVSRDSLDAAENLPKEASRQVAFGRQRDGPTPDGKALSHDGTSGR